MKIIKVMEVMEIVLFLLLLLMMMMLVVVVHNDAQLCTMMDNDDAGYFAVLTWQTTQLNNIEISKCVQKKGADHFRHRLYNLFNLFHFDLWNLRQLKPSSSEKLLQQQKCSSGRVETPGLLVLLCIVGAASSARCVASMFVLFALCSSFLAASRVMTLTGKLPFPLPELSPANISRVQVWRMKTSQL